MLEYKKLKRINIKKFIYINFAFIFTLLAVCIIDFYSFDDKSHDKNINSFISVTNIAGIVSSVSFVETRVNNQDDYSNRFYPDLKPISKMKFAYE